MNIELLSPSGTNFSPSNIYFLLSAKLPEGCNWAGTDSSSRAAAKTPIASPFSNSVSVARVDGSGDR